MRERHAPLWPILENIITFKCAKKKRTAMRAAGGRSAGRPRTAEGARGGAGISMISTGTEDGGKGDKCLEPENQTILAITTPRPLGGTQLEPRMPS